MRRARVGSRGRSAALVAAAFVVAACLDAPVASVVPTPTRAPEPTATISSYTLDTTVWYEGLVVTFGRVTAELDPLGGPVTLSIHIENPGTDLGQLDAQVLLILGETVVEPTRDSHIPTIPAGGLADVVLEYDVQGIGSIAGGVIQLGADPLHLGLVPITSPADSTTLEPRSFAYSASGAAGGLRLRLRHGLLRWDLPDWSEELDAKSAALTLTYDVTYTGTFPGGYAFTGDNVILRLPNGASVGPRRDGRSQSVELIGPGKTKVNLFSRFIVPSGLTGQYRLILRDGSAQKLIAFPVPA